MLPHCTKFQHEQLVRQNFLKVEFSRTTEDDQQNDKKLGQKHNQLSGTSLSQTGPRFPLLNVVVRDNFTSINIIFFISHLFRKLNFSK